ncbi:MAG: flagellar motor protein MotB [Gammaproteobacteria bacterium]|nr:flagellar motor protein MotB [Gammaproteobacteria bacterium]MCW8988768.1 flagellar motor protein MotB [Gammaproteobacteria bacterium]MCW9030811.1 flagellar motor protein MotB [Gammaproteobacteria bacterium]
MADDKKQPIVIKKIVKGGGHHGGAWKVAYADFVTAMMAFFLLLWLLGVTDEAMRGGISEMFKAPSPLIGPGGASTSMIKLGGTKEIPHGDGEKLNQKAPNEEVKPEVKEVIDTVAIAKEKKTLDQLMEKLKETIEQSDMLKDFKDQMLLEVTPEGLRIQIIDKEKRPMFSAGSEKLKPYTRVILRELAKTITRYAPNQISITGHTDASVFGQGIIEYETIDGEVLRKKYSNWELSSDRANAARRELIKGGMPAKQVGRVVGLSSSVLFDKNNPYSPVNRRISIIVMNQATLDSIAKSEGKTAVSTN